jgi:hypothetical protein
MLYRCFIVLQKLLLHVLSEFFAEDTCEMTGGQIFSSHEIKLNPDRALEIVTRAESPKKSPRTVWLKHPPGVFPPQDFSRRQTPCGCLSGLVGGMVAPISTRKIEETREVAGISTCSRFSNVRSGLKHTLSRMPSVYRCERIRL